jgi:hypothetical protein
MGVVLLTLWCRDRATVTTPERTRPIAEHGLPALIKQAVAAMQTQTANRSDHGDLRAMKRSVANAYVTARRARAAVMTPLGQQCSSSAAAVEIQEHHKQLTQAMEGLLAAIESCEALGLGELPAHCGIARRLLTQALSMANADDDDGGDVAAAAEDRGDGAATMRAGSPALGASAVEAHDISEFSATCDQTMQREDAFTPSLRAICASRPVCISAALTHSAGMV